MQNISPAKLVAALPELEENICAILKNFFSFSSHTLYFPQEGADKAEYLANEKRLILPILYQDQNLGILILDRVSKNIRQLLPWLPQLASVALELALTRKALNQNIQTGLANEDFFYSHLENIVQNVHNTDNSQIAQSASRLHKLCLGMIIISWPISGNMSFKLNSEAQRNIFNALSEELGNCLPSESIGSILGKYEEKYEFGIILPAISENSCKKAAIALSEHLEKTLGKMTSGRPGLIPCLFTGCALYPNDMDGEHLRLPIFDQTLILRDKARLAAKLAAKASAASCPERVLTFSSILKGAGKIIEILDAGKVLINLGFRATVKEGMRFQTERSGLITGQIVILETHALQSFGEILETTSPALRPEPGDSLQWLPLEEAQVKPIDATKLDWLGHGNFFKAFTTATDKNFVLGLCRLKDKAQREILINSIEKEDLNTIKESPIVLGKYGVSGLVFYHPGKNTKDVDFFYRELYNTGKKLNLNTSFGLFEFPFLDLAKMESENCVLKALEYGALLPEPHIGVFDSIALNISADKKSSMGDTFGAVKEYELAVLADKTNANAWNSLGVALASLGKEEEARQDFIKALRHCNEPALFAKIYYNLGVLYQKMEETRLARSSFKKCITHEPTHAFAWLRLGQLDEKQGRKKEAKEACLQALNLSGNNLEIANAARRQLARLEWACNNLSEARAILHESLVANPNDAITLGTLAKLYLVDNEDPGMAEMLAGKCLELGGYPEAQEVIIMARAARNNYNESGGRHSG